MSDHMGHLPGVHEPEHSAHGAGGTPQTSFWRSKTGLVTIAFLLIGAFFLVTEHRAHLLGWLPWVILLACPLLHMFVHGGHGNHGAHGGSEPPARSDPNFSGGA